MARVGIARRWLRAVYRRLKQAHRARDIALECLVFVGQPCDLRALEIVLRAGGHVVERAKLELGVRLAFLAAQRALAEHVVEDALRA